jgi:hypothetical protein
MAVSLTPLLDKEIIKLRRKLGDMFDTAGNEIVGGGTTDVSSPGTGKIWVGTTYDASLNAQELLDTYNDAIRSFIDYVIRFIDPKDWYLWIPGYLQLKDSIDLSVTTSPARYYYDLSGLTDFYWVLDVQDANVTNEHGIGRLISPTEYFTDYINLLSTRKNQLLYTRMRYNITTQKDCLMVINPTLAGSPTPKATINLVYIRMHTDYVYNSATPGDLSSITGIGLRRVLTIAESMALRYRSQEVKDLPDVEIQTTMAMDSKRSTR